MYHQFCRRVVLFNVNRQCDNRRINKLGLMKVIFMQDCVHVYIMSTSE